VIFVENSKYKFKNIYLNIEYYFYGIKLHAILNIHIYNLKLDVKDFKRKVCVNAVIKMINNAALTPNKRKTLLI
jgi:hypothetical protein